MLTTAPSMTSSKLFLIKRAFVLKELNKFVFSTYAWPTFLYWAISVNLKYVKSMGRLEKHYMIQSEQVRGFRH